MVSHVPYVMAQSQLFCMGGYNTRTGGRAFLPCESVSVRITPDIFAALHSPTGVGPSMLPVYQHGQATDTDNPLLSVLKARQINPLFIFATAHKALDIHLIPPGRSIHR